MTRVSQQYFIFRTGGILWSIFGILAVAATLMLLFSVVQLTSVSSSDNVQHMKALVFRNYSTKPPTTISNGKGAFVSPSSKLYTLLPYRGIGSDNGLVPTRRQPIIWSKHIGARRCVIARNFWPCSMTPYCVSKPQHTEPLAVHGWQWRHEMEILFALPAIL